MHLLERPLRRIAGSRVVAAATWPHGVDRYAELVAPAWATTDVRARVLDVRRQTADTVTLRLRPNRNWPGHQAGQHVLLTVAVAGVRHTRCFSVSSSAHDDRTIELTCKAGPESVVSQHLRSRAAVGDVIELSPPKGDFVLPAERPAALALLSGGSGITPVLAMLRTLHDEGHDGDVVFVHYARSAADVLHADELRSIEATRPGVRVVVVTEDLDNDDDPTVLHGRFSPSHLAATGIVPERFDAFVCGPAPFMDAVADAWTEAGGDPDRFRTERFGPPPRPATGATGGTVRFATSGIDVADDGRSILEQAEAAGLQPAHGCRMGICHSCIRPKTAGCVRDAVTGELTSDDGVTVRICVSVPVGDVEIDL